MRAKQLRQNFLKNRLFLRKIAQSLSISPQDIVKIGGGHGKLTKFLTQAKN
jgi:16S rRNA A1518/A1519 N6-dimethyltransferase RsmA/KsgA/DIM1 with predicted DNA glycosylase/AP lyase activity